MRGYLAPPPSSFLGLLFVALFAAALPAQAVPAQMPRAYPRTPVAKEAAGGFFSAWRADDFPAQRVITDDTTLDFMMIGAALFDLHVEACLREPPVPTDYLDAAQTLAEATAKCASARGLAPLIAKWRSLPTAELQREGRLRDLVRRLEELGAFAHVEQALAMLAAPPGPDDLAAATSSLLAFRLRLVTARLLAETPDKEAAAAAFRAAVVGARQLDHPSGLVTCLAELAILDHRRGQVGAALPCLQEELALREALGQRTVVTLANLALAHSVVGPVQKVIEYAERALPEADEWLEGGKPSVLRMIGAAYEDLGAFEEATRCNEAALAMASERDDRHGVANALLRLGSCLRSDSRFDEALVHHRRGLATFEELGDESGVAALHVQIGLDHRAAGRCLDAIQHLDEASARYERLGRSDMVASVSGEAGSAYEQLGEHRRARELHRRAFTMQDACGSHVIATETLLKLGSLEANIGDLPQAVRTLEDARQRFAGLGVPRWEAIALERLASVRRQAGQFDLSEQLLKQAILTIGEGAHADDVPRFTHALGELAEERGRHQQALELQRRALAMLPARCSAVIRSEIERSIATSLMQLGRYGEALAMLTDLMQTAERAGWRSHAATMYESLGVMYAELGMPLRAIELLQRCVEVRDQCGMDLGAATARVNLGATHQGLGDHARALEYLLPAQQQLEQLGGRGSSAIALVWIAAAQRGTGCAADAGATLARAEAMARELGDEQLLACILADRGEMCLDQRQFETGERYLRDGIDRLSELGLVHRTIGARSSLAALYSDQGRLDLAIDASRQAIVDAADGTYDLAETEAFGLRDPVRRAADIGVSAALGIQERGPEHAQHALEEAFWHLESGRNLLLARGLENRSVLRRSGLPAAMVEAEAVAAARVSASQKRLAGLVAQHVDAGALDAARRDLDQACRARQDVLARVHREATKGARLIQPTPVELVALEQSLDANTALVLYQLTADRAAAIVVERSGATLVDLGSSDAIERRVRAYVRLVGVPGTDDGGQAAALYELLLRPLEGRIAGKQRLVIAPDGVLSFLPFEALVRMDGARVERLLTRCELSYVPSATIWHLFTQEQRPAGDGVVALGDPLYPGEDLELGSVVLRDAELRGLEGLARLVGSGEEARAVAALFGPEASTVLLRGDASRDALLHALRERQTPLRALHLACHGHVDTERPRLTGLVLAGAEMLTLDDVQQLPLEADLVVLSACESAVGKLTRGEGVQGLVRAFFLAGAPRVVVTNWKVHDQGARTLMVRFYERLRGGLGTGAALRAAKLELLRAGGDQAHPAQWAGFVLWGRGD